MADFFEKLSRAVTFEVQMYILMAVFFVMIIFCFIMLLIVGMKYKQLSSKVEEMEETKEDTEKAEETEYAWIKEYINRSLQEKSMQEEKLREQGEEKDNCSAPSSGDEKSSPGHAEDTELETVDENADKEDVADNNEEVSENNETEIDGDNDADSEQSETASAPVVAAGLVPAFVDETNQRIAELSAEIGALTEKTKEVEKKVSETAALQRKGFDKIKVVRYSSPEEDGKTAPGYSIGITNQDCEGIVLTGITREDQGTTLEVKSIRNGVSNTPLTKAEECAVVRKNKE